MRHPQRRPIRRRRANRLGFGMLALLAAALVVAAAWWTSGGHDGGAATEPAPPAAMAKPEVVPVPDTAPMPTVAGLAAALAASVSDPNLGWLSGRITDAMTGKELWAQQGDLPMQPASTNKVLTTAAALLTLDRNARVTTRVTAGDQPGVIVLVGGGDPTLSAAPPGQETWYRDAARISDLVDQVRRSGAAPTAIQVDTSAFSGPTMAPGWDPLDIEGGDIAPIESVMLDGGRTQPVSAESRRSMTPALDAGRALADALGIDARRVTMATSATSPTSAPSAPSSRSATGATGDTGLTLGRELGSVRSAPLIQRLGEMMNASDNVMAECIGREVAAAMHRPRSFSGAVDAVTNRLATAHVELGGTTLVDSSGLSVDDRFTAKTLDEVVQAAAGPGEPALRPLLDMLPVAGGSGTLSERFLDRAADHDTAGWLRAKTGSLTRTNALAGVVTDRSWRVLTFAFISNDAGPTGRTAIDAVAAILRSCGCGS